MVNSGSSANLLAISTPDLAPAAATAALRPGDEVITVAAGFPTTVNPIVQNGLVPVFVDVELPTYNIDVSQLEAAISPRTRAVMIAHTLGNPFDLDAVDGVLPAPRSAGWSRTAATRSARPTTGQPVGTFGDLATLSASIPPTTSRWARAARC